MNAQEIPFDPLVAGLEAPNPEAMVLGCMLRFPETVAEGLELLTEDDFVAGHYRMIFTVIRDLFRRGMEITAPAVGIELMARGQYGDVGGFKRFGDHAEGLYYYTFARDSVRVYAPMLQDARLVRDLRYVGSAIMGLADRPLGPPAEMLAEAERKVFELAERRQSGGHITLATAVHQSLDRLDSRASGHHNDFLQTGWVELDGLLVGLPGSDLIIIAARPSVGKTALGLCLARHVAVELGFPVFFASLEQKEIDLADRLLCCEAKVDSWNFRHAKLSEDQKARLILAQQRLVQAPVFIDSWSSQSTTRIAAACRRIKSAHGLRLVIVDYLQLVDPENPKESRQEQVAGISRRLKQLAREINVPVVAMAQLNRAVEYRAGERPKLADLRESGGIEADADTVILLHRSKNQEGKSDNVLDIIVAKQRNGPTGEVSLYFNKSLQRFDNYAPGLPE